MSLFVSSAEIVVLFHTVHTAVKTCWLTLAVCLFYILHIYEHVLAVFLSLNSMTWVARCRWLGLEMAQGWVYLSPFAPNMFYIRFVVWFLQTWLCRLNADDTLKGLMHLHKWCMLHFPQAKPSFLAGYSGLDDVSGPFLHGKTWTVETLSKVMEFTF